MGVGTGEQPDARSSAKPRAKPLRRDDPTTASAIDAASPNSSEVTTAIMV